MKIIGIWLYCSKICLLCGIVFGAHRRKEKRNGIGLLLSKLVYVGALMSQNCSFPTFKKFLAFLAFLPDHTFPPFKNFLAFLSFLLDHRTLRHFVFLPFLVGDSMTFCNNTWEFLFLIQLRGKVRYLRPWMETTKLCHFGILLCIFVNLQNMLQRKIIINNKSVFIHKISLFRKMPLLPLHLLSFGRPTIATEITAQKLLSQQFATLAEEEAASITFESISAKNVNECQKRTPCKRTPCKVTKAISSSKTSGYSDSTTKKATPLAKAISRRVKTSGSIKKSEKNAKPLSRSAQNSAQAQNISLPHTSTYLDAETDSLTSSQSQSQLTTKVQEERHLLPAPIIEFEHDEDDIFKFCH